MGSFSFLFANKQFRCDHSVKNIVYGHPFVLLFPDGRKWVDKAYQDYGIIRNPETQGEVDVYALLAFWNRDWILNHPDFIIPDLCMSSSKDKILNFRNLFLNREAQEEDIKKLQKELENGSAIANEALRYIGIEIRFKHKNESNVYQLKFVTIKEAPSLKYKDLEASEDDPNQGFYAFTKRYDSDDEEYYA